MRSFRVAIRLAAALSCTAILAAVVASCGGGGGEHSIIGPTQTPASLTLVSGNSQTATAGQACNAPLVVKVATSSGAAASGVLVAWSVLTGGGSLNATTSTSDVNGLASVTWTLGPTAGTNSVSASVPSVTTIPPVTFTATGATLTPVAAKVAFTVQPSTVLAGAVMAPAVKVAIEDAQGNTVSTATGNVTVTITAGTGTTGAVLGGTTTVAAVNGVATFSQLTVDRMGNGYSLTALSSGLTSGTSSAFNTIPYNVVVINNSFTPLAATVSSTPASPQVPAGGGVFTFQYPYGKPASVPFIMSTSGKTSSGTQVGLLIVWSGTWTPSTDNADTLIFNVPATYFFLKVQNHSAYTLENLYVNWGLTDQSYDAVVMASSTTTTYALGYYDAHTNSVIHLDNGAGLTWIWTYGVNFTLPGTINQAFIALGT